LINITKSANTGFQWILLEANFRCFHARSAVACGRDLTEFSNMEQQC